MLSLDSRTAALQMEKRSSAQDGQDSRDPIQRCRLVLQRALVANPHNAAICQVPAWLRLTTFVHCR